MYLFLANQTIPIQLIGGNRFLFARPCFIQQHNFLSIAINTGVNGNFSIHKLCNWGYVYGTFSP